MKFSPTNDIVRLCIQAMRLEETEDLEKARQLFRRAWNEATDDHERLLAAHHLSRQQLTAEDQLSWLETALQLALKVDNEATWAALPFLHSRIAECQEHLGDREAADKHRDLAASLQGQPRDSGPFYHGTRASLQVGDLLSPGNQSNYDPGLLMNHIYFTASVDGAGLAAALCQGGLPERVYLIEPTGSFEDDPNVTNKRFPGNPTRSYRSKAPLRVIGEEFEWVRPAPEIVRSYRERSASKQSEIVN